MQKNHNLHLINESLKYQVTAHSLPQFLQTLTPTDKKILIRITGEITYDIREKIQAAFVYNDFEQLDIQLDLSQAVWDSLYCIENWMVRSIILPDSVTDIDGSMIFSPVLEEIIVSEANPKLSTIDGVLYNKDRTVFLRCPQGKAGSFVIPDSVTEIGISGFSKCKNLTDIKLPVGLKILKENAFRECSLLKEICIPNGTIELGQSVFENCASLINVKLPDSVAVMGSRVFAECKNLKSVELPENITEIPVATFVNCQMLEEVKLSSDVKTVGLNAFRNCSSLKEIELTENTEVQAAAFCETTKIIKSIKAELQIPGRYNTAKVFTDNIDSDAYSQILQMMNQSWAEGLSVRIMPDVHAGRGCTVGTTMTIAGRIVPSLVGDDIGCGVDVLVVKKDFCGLANGKLDLTLLDEIVHQNIPAGAAARKKPHAFVKQLDAANFIAPIDVESSKLQLGTLGGGNHFIEVDVDDDGNYYFVIHSGSRHLGKAVCSFYQELADRSEDKSLSGKELENYLHDMNLAQNYAALNRLAMLDEIKKGLQLKKSDILEEFSTIHNYIDLKNRVLRKGAISAHKGERLIIPMNMRDGSLICIGKGNSDWNCSAPHGAGRLYKRSEAKELFTVEEYKEAMKGIYSTSIGHSTLDESPMAYKPMNSILDKIKPTVQVEKIIKPIYNFKAGGQ